METCLQNSEVEIPKNDNFEFLSNNKTNASPIKSPCQYFKSSFARSLSFNTNQSQSLDFELSFRISKSDNVSSPIKETVDNPDVLACSPVSRPSKGPFLVSTMPKRKYISNSRLLQESKNKSFSSEIEVLRLRKECQNLIENNRRLMDSSLSSEHFSASNNTVEETLLQTQVESLQWQLKQVESSRQMYHAVMEEVVRFLDRCHQSLDAMQTNQIGRSKSINHVFGTEYDSKVRMKTNTLEHSNGISNDSNGTLSGSYSNFRDFTWRRSPKQPLSTNHNIELNPEKLSQEAFRLLRTAQNLISLKEPCLTDTQNDSSSIKSCDYNNAPAINRKINSRESRLSIQSSTDDSVHSTSSSRNETDEETAHVHTSPANAFCLLPSSRLNRKEDFMKSMTHSADDESGFSSMNSFQEIGLPTHILSGSEKSADSAPETIPEDDNDNEANNVTICTSETGKIKQSLPIFHRRWESAPPIPPKRNLSTYNGDDVPKVLWV